MPEMREKFSVSAVGVFGSAARAEQGPGSDGDILVESLEECVEFAEGMSYEAFALDRKTFKAVVRNLEIAGEAVKAIPEEIEVEHPRIPWKLMAGVRRQRSACALDSLGMNSYY
jgi:predicted nucleotidyltransferase